MSKCGEITSTAEKPEHTHVGLTHNDMRQQVSVVIVKKLRVVCIALDSKLINNNPSQSYAASCKQCWVKSLSLSLSLSLSSRVVVDQHTRPQVHARLHGLVTPPRVRWSSFQSASRYCPRSLVEDGRVLLCRELVDIVHRYFLKYLELKYKKYLRKKYFKKYKYFKISSNTFSSISTLEVIKILKILTILKVLGISVFLSSLFSGKCSQDFKIKPAYMRRKVLYFI